MLEIVRSVASSDTRTIESSGPVTLRSVSVILFMVYVDLFVIQVRGLRVGDDGACTGMYLWEQSDGVTISGDILRAPVWSMQRPTLEHTQHK